ncbi:alpha/beta hydrolase [Streptomyces sp. RB6PN25]|uniref:Alpha/beta hydrolase n=1 Tax=Streptomyces humicola TaxID=2953240 RepID=A0ABT1Q138_9ACTN|nr:alpha/beta hydrolase [Streptomyces humicola]MCQ4083078.1 alpha/beta hydrolase [Streptomyces humicola]
MRAAALYGGVAAVALAGFAALSTAPAAPAAPASSDPATVADERGVAVAAAQAQATGVKFGPCAPATGLPRPIRCGTVSVPLDYAHPEGTRIALTVSRLAATGPAVRRQGALVYNPGGPGASGLYFPMYALRHLRGWAHLARAYDFVGFDPRGVGRSEAISCESPAQFTKAPTPDPDPVTQADKERRIAAAKAYADGCERRSGRMLPYLTTANNARDLDVIRAALGEPQLNFLGASYGTYLGEVYAALFPGHVRRMVLDSVVDPAPDRIWYRANLDQDLAFQRRWLDWCSWVARHDAIYHLGTTPQAVQRAYDRVRTAVDKHPAGGVIGGGELQAAYLNAGYYDQTWPKLAKALSAYVHGRPEELVAQAAPNQAHAAAAAENENAVYTAVECADGPWPRSFATWDRDNSSLARRAPFETWGNAWMNLPCAYWRAPSGTPVDVSLAPGELPPVLMLAAERDAATPYAGALDAHRRLPDSVLVTEKGSGSHGISGGPNRCVNAHVDAYLLHGDTFDGDVTCDPHPQPQP